MDIKAILVIGNEFTQIVKSNTESDSCFYQKVKELEYLHKLNKNKVNLYFTEIEDDNQASQAQCG